jgi:hypothetical protein
MSTLKSRLLLEPKYLCYACQKEYEEKKKKSGGLIEYSFVGFVYYLYGFLTISSVGFVKRANLSYGRSDYSYVEKNGNYFSLSLLR